MSASTSNQRRQDLAAEGEYVLTRRNFEQIASTLRDYSGIHLSSAKANLVYSRLAKRLRNLGLRSFDEYCALVESEAGADERGEMIASLTTNVTRFFREPHHFDHLRDKVLPDLMATARAGGRVRIWSSACSSGEEPYSIAMTLLGVFPDAAKYDVRILATDIDPNILAVARTGAYGNEAVSPIPARLRDACMSRRGEGDRPWSVKDDVRRLIAFRQVNLIAPWPMKGQFDVIFCRNVVIYFEDATQAEIWSKFARALTPQGRLYVGHSERVDAPGFVGDGLTVYRRSGKP